MESVNSEYEKKISFRIIILAIALPVSLGLLTAHLTFSMLNPQQANYKIIFGISVVLLAVGLNLLTVVKNGGKMPVYVPEEELKHKKFRRSHVFFSKKETIKLFSLCDRFRIPLPRRKNWKKHCFIYSIGDIFALIGFLIIQIGVFFPQWQF